MKISRTILPPVKYEYYDVSPQKHLNLYKDQVMAFFQPSIDYLHRFAVGDMFWFVADFTKGVFLNVGGQAEKLTGIKSEDFVGNPPTRLFEITHPEDVKGLFAFSDHYIRRLMQADDLNQMRRYHPTVYLRAKNINGLYQWLMVQFADFFVDDSGNVVAGLSCSTDISHIKTEGPCMMSIYDSELEVCQHFYCYDGNRVEERKLEIPSLSLREIEVLNYLSIGLSSKQIAYELGISIKTVDNHRQNMLHKTNSKSSSELINFAVKTGYL